MAEDSKVAAEKLAEKQAEKAANILAKIDPERLGEVTTADQPGSLIGMKYDSPLQMIEVAKLMSVSGNRLPIHLRNNVGGCLAIVIQAYELEMSPFRLAMWEYEVEQKGVRTVTWMSAFYNAVILARAPIKSRPKYDYLGEGDERRCKITFHIRGEDEPRTFITDTLAKLRPPRNQEGVVKGSPLWDKKPDLQLAYNGIRDIGRLYFPDVTAGLYTKEEIEEGEFGPDAARVVSPSSGGLLNRLTPSASASATREGFTHTATAEKIAEAINAARSGNTPDTNEKKKNGGTTITETATETATSEIQQKDSMAAS